jgi:peroxiredoxin
MRRASRPVLQLIILVSLTLFSVVPAMAQYSIGEVGPDFTLPDLDNNPVSLYDFQGDIIVVNFFATWCPGCNVESLQLQEDIYEAYSDQDVTVLGVDLLEPAELVQAWRDEMGLTYPMVLAPDWSLFQQFPIAGGIPYNAIFDRDMVLQYAQYGFNLENFIGVIESILDANPVDLEPSSLERVKALYRNHP